MGQPGTVRFSVKRVLASVLPAVRSGRGVSAAEYAILSVGVVIVVGAAVATLGGPLTDAFATIGSEVANQQSSLSNGGAR